MNQSEKIAERVIKLAYEKGDILDCADIDGSVRKLISHNVGRILCEYGVFK